MKWNVPEKYGPHGELFFFLIQKESATMLVGETDYSPLPQCRHPHLLSLLMSSRSVRLSPCTESWNREEAEKVDIK